MTKNSSTTVKQKQPSRSFFEMVAVYKKLAKFYSYNFFVQKGSYLLTFTYLVASVTPLVTLLLSKYNQKFRGFLIEKEIFGRIFGTLIGNHENIFQLWYATFFLFFISRDIKQRIFYFLEAKDNDKTNPRQEEIISSVKKIKFYDIFIFEFTSMLLINLLFLIPVLGSTLLVNPHNCDYKVALSSQGKEKLILNKFLFEKEFIYLILKSNFLSCTGFLFSYRDLTGSLLSSLSYYCEYFVRNRNVWAQRPRQPLSAQTLGSSFNEVFSILILPVTILVQTIFFLKGLYSSYLKMKRVRDGD